MPAADPVKVALAVQGGGAHGAFSWGVLDALLDDAKVGNITIAALSGTSAGAFNASVAAYGLGMFPDDIAKAADHAKALLREFWMGDASLAPFSIYTTTAAFHHALTGSWNIDTSPLVMGLDMAGTIMSPYGLPTVEWLKIALGRTIDFAKLRAQTAGPALYVTATNINHNRRDIFARSAIDYDVLAASACIPSVFQAHQVPVDDLADYYWDGGYMGNPALAPLVDHGDIIVIQVNAFERPDSPPRTAPAILDRINEITFNSSLVLELSDIQSHNHRLDQTGDGCPTYLHQIRDEPYMISLGYASKQIINTDFLEELRAAGHAAGTRWLAENRDALGKRTTLDEDILDRTVSRTKANIIHSRPQHHG